MSDFVDTASIGLRHRHQARLLFQHQQQQQQQQDDFIIEDDNSIVEQQQGQQQEEDSLLFDDTIENINNNNNNGDEQQQQQQQPTRMRTRLDNNNNTNTTLTRMGMDPPTLFSSFNVNSNNSWKVSHWYCLFSTVMAIVAIIIASPTTVKTTTTTTTTGSLQQPQQYSSLSSLSSSFNKDNNNNNLDDTASFVVDEKNYMITAKAAMSNKIVKNDNDDNDDDDKKNSTTTTTGSWIIHSAIEWMEYFQKQQQQHYWWWWWWQSNNNNNNNGRQSSDNNIHMKEGHDKSKRGKANNNNNIVPSSRTNRDGNDDDISIKQHDDQYQSWWSRLFWKETTTTTSSSTPTDDKKKERSDCNKIHKKNKKHNKEQNNDNDNNNNNSWRDYFMVHWWQLDYQKYYNDFLNRHQYDIYLQWIDPVLLHPTSDTTTIIPNIIDKILTSTPRLVAIVNFVLAVTYLLHSAVAACFLGTQQQQQQQEEQGSVGNNNNNNNNNASQQQQRQRQQVPAGMVVDWTTSAAGARERMGGFLVFKLLLISAVVAPDTLDLLILLTWYTWLSCLRSLDHLAHTTTTHLAALGQTPRTGPLQLLVWVLVCDISAAISCVALFHAAGWGMVLLLTCDCALLGADVLSHILKHYQCVLEDTHTNTIHSLETRQLELHNARHNNNNNSNNNNNDVSNNHNNNDGEIDHGSIAENDADAIEREENSQEDGLRPARAASTMTRLEVQQESRRLDLHMETLELTHSRRLSLLDTVIFFLELVCHLLTVAHFCHIWSLHGMQFTLIDGVLALHLHSAISTACRKIALRRSIHGIARDLHGHFPNATDEELRKASTAGDVCCICLGTMSTGGHVKKVKCGHLYHTHCLREVVDRAQSIQAAKCPLCRASLLEAGTHAGGSSNTVLQRNPQAIQPGGFMVGGDGTVGRNDTAVGNQILGQAGGERALFRFSTEGILPVWLPVPAFSFEVVRRPPTAVQQAPVAAQNTTNRDLNNAGDENNPRPVPRAVEQQQDQGNETSFLRRLLVLAGAVPMSPEEEARALAQLVDMFPQYHRSDLLRELRERGSPEAVAEAVLMGIFSGIPRGD